MTHICISELPIIGSDNGLSPGRRQAIIWTNAGILLNRILGINFSEILSEIHIFSFKKMHYDDVIMTMLASQITSLTVVYSIVYSGVNQRKHQSSASLAFVRAIHRGPVNFPHKWPVTRKMFPFDDVIMVVKNVVWKTASILSRPQCVNRLAIQLLLHHCQVCLLRAITHHETGTKTPTTGCLWWKPTRGQTFAK